MFVAEVKGTLKHPGVEFTAPVVQSLHETVQMAVMSCHSPCWRLLLGLQSEVQNTVCVCCCKMPEIIYSEKHFGSPSVTKVIGLWLWASNIKMQDGRKPYLLARLWPKTSQVSLSRTQPKDLLPLPCPTSLRLHHLPRPSLMGPLRSPSWRFSRALQSAVTGGTAYSLSSIWSVQSLRYFY